MAPTEISLLLQFLLSSCTKEPPKLFYVDLGENFTIECNASGLPKPTVEWTGLLLPQGRIRQKDGKLSISEVQMQDSGNYTCKVSNNREEITAVTKIVVFLDSKILQDHPDYSKQLTQYLQPVTKKGKEWKRCFRASENYFNSISFHRQCNHKGPTVTLVRVGLYVFGGYTDKSWIASSGYTYSFKAFLFSLNNHLNQSFKSETYRNHVNAIYSNNSYGPTFGGGHDLHLANQCHVSTNSYTNLGYTCRPPFGYGYASSQARNIFAGSYNFRCDEYEVFYQGPLFRLAEQDDFKSLQDYLIHSKQLAQYLQPVKTKGKEWKRCFRASENYFDSILFHRQCNYKGPTVTMVRVGSYVFGGYTDQNWTTSSSYTNNFKAFLFSLNNHLNQPFKSETYRKHGNAIYNYNNVYGPTFGGGHDLHLANQCHVNTNSYSKLGYTYRPPFSYGYASSQARSIFAGSYNFTCDEYEVFYQA